MPRSLIDLLWRGHPGAPSGGSRGPRARISTDAAIDAAIGLADAEGLSAVTVRRLAGVLGVSTMSIYTYVNSRDDLLVLMVDAARSRMDRPALEQLEWQAGVRRVAEANMSLFQAHPWLLEVIDDRAALGPGTIAKYDHELAAIVPLGLDDVTCDAALSFVLNFVRASAQAHRPGPRSGELAEHWPEWSIRLSAYIGDDFPLAQRIGMAAGEAMGAAYSPSKSWEFGLNRVIHGLATLTQTHGRSVARS